MATITTTEFEIIERAIQQTAVVKATTTVRGLGMTLGQIFQEVGAALHRAAMSPSGPPLATFHLVTPEHVELEAGFPTPMPFHADGRVAPGELPGGLWASAWHIGPYEGMEEVYGRLASWIGREGHAPAGAPTEVYYSEPTADPATWRTQILWPIT